MLSLSMQPGPRFSVGQCDMLRLQHMTRGLSIKANILPPTVFILEVASRGVTRDVTFCYLTSRYGSAGAAAVVVAVVSEVAASCGVGILVVVEAVVATSGAVEAQKQG